jgi:hypothetical protein
MAERRTLTEGMETKLAPPMDPATERAFVYASSDKARSAGKAAAVRRVPITTRIREDYAKALKRASLERQLGGTEPSAILEMLEQALEPWLRAQGYIE